MELLLNTMVTSIVDDVESVSVQEAETEKEGRLFEIKVGKDDVGKVIGKQGRIASALRTVAKAAGAKNGEKIMINVFNKPLE
ncbi:RNA-binding protein [Candidatus Pacearchaeota archaeon]|nr:RNA-binding protein [Candidatus Pacearchaeota archaeon]